jgi:hypothetical protein
MKHQYSVSYFMALWRRIISFEIFNLWIVMSEFKYQNIRAYQRIHVQSKETWFSAEDLNCQLLGQCIKGIFPGILVH